MNPKFQRYLLNITQSTSCNEIEVIQSLWSGYGKISRYQLVGSSFKTVVIKNISLNQIGDHPRGWDTDLSHNRKVKSYQVETHWYEKWNQLCTDNCRTPKFIGSYSEGDNQWIVLEDLDTNFPIRKMQLNISKVKVCLKWLAHFHATFLNINAVDLWEVGSYWHLDTRPDEFEKIQNQELKSKAHSIDKILKECKYQTIIHGDAKLANFCFSENGKQVAGVDFQYVGRGCGMKDVAYFLGSCLSSDELEQNDKDLLKFYFVKLREATLNCNLNIDSKALEAEWQKMYPIACADFTRFIMGWTPSHQKVNDYQLKIIASVLSNY